MNQCYQGGYLVSSKHELPKDPMDYHVHGLPLLGCTRIRCQQCRMLARSLVDTWFKDENAAVDMRDLYEMPDPSLSPLLVPIKGGRLYLCRCKRWLEHSDRPLQDPDPDLTSPNLPWACDGHAAAELPRELDGARIANEKELIDVVLASLRGTLPAGASPAYKPRAFYAARMYSRFAGTPHGEAIVRAVSAAMEDPEPDVRARALQFFFTLELPHGMKRAAELLGGDRKLFASVRDTATPVSADRTLEDTLWRIVTPLVAGSPKLRDVARADALAPSKGRESVYTALARGDAPWVAEHAEEIYRATPGLGRDLIDIIRACFPPEVAAKPVVERLRNLLPKP
jgi:hypothetical protein